jgi:hypothetical protein
MKQCNLRNEPFVKLVENWKCTEKHSNPLNPSGLAFCAPSGFMCFVWIWEQTAIISLYRISGLVF